MNKVILMGRIVADPEFSMTQSGIPMCRLRIAVDRNFRQGEEKQSDFFNVTCWRQTAEFVNRYFVKGKPIIVEGRIQNDNYTDQNGVKHYNVSIVADNVHFTLSDPTRAAGGYNNQYNNGGYNNYNNGNGGYQNNNRYNSGYQNNQNYNQNYNQDYQNNQNYNPYPPAPQNPVPEQPVSAPAAPVQPKDIQLGNDSGDNDFNDFEEIISDGALPF